MNLRIPELLCSGLLAVAMPLVAHAQPYQFTKVYESTSSFITNGELNNHGTAIFRDVQQIYTGNGSSLQPILSPTTVGVIGRLSINDNGLIAWGGAYFSPLRHDGLYVTDGVTVTPIAAQPEYTPGTAYRDHSLNNLGQVAGLGNKVTPSPIVLFIADSGVNTPIIDSSGAFGTHLSSFSLNDSGNLAFLGLGEAVGWRIGYYSNGSIATIAESGTTFELLASPVSNNVDTVFFHAKLASTGLPALYISKGGNLTPIVAGDGTFDQLADGSLALNDADEVAFYARPAGGSLGIYNGSDPISDKVVSVGDSLFGSTISSFTSSIDMNNRGQISFVYTLANGMTGVAIANPVPEPAAVTLASFAALAAMTGVRRNRWRGSRAFRPSSLP